MAQKLRALLRSVVLRPAKKYTPSLVADIFPLIKSKENLDDLLQSGYFNILWRFFHADVTNNHLQLILLVAYYELDFCNACSCLQTITSDESKLSDLVVRVLQATMDASANNTALKGASFLFLGALVRFDVSALRGSKLYAKWNENIVDLHLKTFSTLERSAYPGYTSCFVYFYICWAISDNDEKRRIGKLNVSLYFTGSGMGEAVSTRLGDLLALVCYEEEDFVSSQLIFQNYGPRFDFLVLAFSRLDITHTELTEALEELDSQQLEKVAGSMSIETHLPSSPLIEAIVGKVLGPRITTSSCFHISQFTEVDLFDLFDTTYPELAINLLIPYTLNLSQNDLLASEQLRLAWRVLEQINDHLVSTLERLTITDGTKEDGIKGTSKYFYRLESAEFTGRYGSLTTKTPLKIIHDTVILLEIHKRNEHDERSRIKTYGIRAARVAKVITSGDKLAMVHVDRVGDDTYNAFISLPETIPVQSLHQLNEVVKSSTGSPIFDKDGSLDDHAIEAFHLDMEAVKAIEGVELESEKDAGQAFKFKNTKFKIILSGIPNDMFAEAESRALLTMLASKVLVIRADSNSGRSSLTNCFLHTIQHNFPTERCLVVLPTRLAVAQFTLSSQLNSVVKVGDPQNLNAVFNKRKHLLDRVSEISKILGLSDYAFDTNAVNALILFQAHVIPKWEGFLGQLKKSNESIGRYPFKQFEFGDDDSIERMLSDVLEHYSDIKKAFAELQRLLPLDKVDRKDTQAVEEFLTKTSKFTICSIDDLDLLQKYDNIVSFSSSSEVLIPILKGSRRTVLFSPEKFAGIAKFAESLSISSPALPTIGVRSEIAALTGATSRIKSEYNPGFKYTVQHINVAESESQVNIEEARYVVYLFQYFRLLGYPHRQLLVIILSPYMKILIEEILEETNIRKFDEASDDVDGFQFGWPLMQSSKCPFPCDYAIVLSHLGLSMREYVEVAKSAKRGLYFVGSSLSAPYKVKQGDLEIYTGVKFALGTDSRRSGGAYKLEGAEHLGAYVEQMTSTRMGRKRDEKRGKKQN